MRFFDRQKQARAQTRQLLLLFALTLLVLVLAINVGLALIWKLLAGASAYPAGFFTVNTALVLLFVLGGWWIETSTLAGGGEKLARRAGAREAWPASREDEQQLCNVVSELALAAGIRAPQPMVLDRVDSIDAFAAGWNDDDAVLAVTRGALDSLTRDELQGLVAHELGHLREGDTRLNMRLAGMVFGLELIFNLGRRMCEADDDGQRSVFAVPGVAVLACGSAGWLAGRWLKAAVSREREFLADARAVQFTRSRDGLGGVLRKVMGERAGSGIRSGASAARSLHPSLQHLLLVGPQVETRWLATHPPLAERVQRIYGRAMPAMDPMRDALLTRGPAVAPGQPAIGRW